MLQASIADRGRGSGWALVLRQPDGLVVPIQTLSVGVCLVLPRLHQSEQLLAGDVFPPPLGNTDAKTVMGSVRIPGGLALGVWKALLLLVTLALAHVVSEAG